jgi:hypothetical protein
LFLKESEAWLFTGYPLNSPQTLRKGSDFILFPLSLFVCSILEH